MKNTNFSDLSASAPYIIAELACGHEGSTSKFKSLVDAVKSSGANAVKSQIFVPLERVTPEHPEWDIFNKLCFSAQEWQELSCYVKENGLLFFADVFGYDGFEIAKSCDVDGYKIHSEDMLNHNFISAVAAEGKITMIGVGGAHRIEIYQMLNFLSAGKNNSRVVLMPGVQTFPTSTESHSLKEISDLVDKYSQRFGVKVGCADHISGDDPMAMIFPLMSLSEGACVIEKHVTLNREDQWEDYESALSAQAFKDFVHHLKKTLPWLGRVKGLSSEEKQYRRQFKKSPVASVNLTKGDQIKSRSIKYIKHHDKKIPLSTTDLINSTLLESVSQDQFISRDVLTSRVGAVIVARCRSSRLANKAMLPIMGKESILWLIERIKRCNNLDDIVLATSRSSDDDGLAALAEQAGIKTFRGEEDNVANRFLCCADQFSLDHIVRITGDDLVRDESMIDQAIDAHLKSSCDITITSCMPYGTQTEIFTYKVIKAINNNVINPKDTEYLEWFLQNDRLFSICYVKGEYEFDERIRLTLDYEEDLVFFETIFSALSRDNASFTLADILRYIKENPWVKNINSHRMPRYNITRNAHGLYETEDLELAISL